MDSENFEQQFTQSVKVAPPPPVPVSRGSKTNTKPLLTIISILAIVVLIEAFALAVTLVNYFEVFETDGSSEEVTFEDGEIRESTTNEVEE